jgi:phosphopantetheinyl transferase (holo-ACP synthase)
MSQTGQLQEIIATLLMMAPGEVKPETSLQPLNTSLGNARLGLALKRAGMQLPGNRVPATFRDLEMSLNGDAAPPAPAQTPLQPPLPTAASDLQAGLQVGLDVQEIGDLPVAVDYWDHEFYRGTFDKSEIAYAVVQPEPRTHLAGFWCAKEALRKCDPSFAGISPASTAVAHDGSGRPYLLSVTSAGRTRLPHALSISHTGQVASAVVVFSPAPPPAAVPQPVQPGRAPKPVPPAPAVSSTAGSPVIAGILVVLTLAIIYLFIRSSA